MIAILFILFFFLVFLGVPISITLGIASVGALAFGSDYDLVICCQKMYQSVNSFSLMAIPFFMLAGSLMSGGGISQRIVAWCDSLVGHVTGGLAMVGILACMIFASISGSAVATVAAIGGLLIPEMKKRSYPDDFSTAIMTAAGTMGPIIPPSIGFVLYASMANVSVRDMFLGGYIPGILMGLALMVFAYFSAKKHKYPKKEQRSSGKEILLSTKDALWALITPIIIIGGIMFGVFSPTEAGAIACFYAWIVGAFVYKELTFKKLVFALKDAAITSTVCLYLICTASIFSWILTAEKIPQLVATAFITLTDNKYVILLLINLLLLVVGMFIDATPAIIMLTPVFVPLMQQLGVNLVHFGVFMELNLCIGLLTPPVGSCLFVGCKVGEIEIGRLIRKIIPLILILVAVCLLVTYVPQTVTWLPSLFK